MSDRGDKVIYRVYQVSCKTLKKKTLHLNPRWSTLQLLESYIYIRKKRNYIDVHIRRVPSINNSPGPINAIVQRRVTNFSLSLRPFSFSPHTISLCEKVSDHRCCHLVHKI